MVKRNIAVVYGGDSSEYVVSVKSGQNVFNSIDATLFNKWLVEVHGQQWTVIDGGEAVPVERSDFSFMRRQQKIRFDFVYIIIHGTPGEDGILQGYFDLLGIPYSTCGVQASALTFNKHYCSNFLRTFGIPMAPSVLVRRHEPVDVPAITAITGLPAFVKPNAGGSSFGVTKVKSEADLDAAILSAWAENSDALVEAFIEGREYTCGLVKLRARETVFPVTEVIPRNEFFDYEAKYTKGMTEEITPARLDDADTRHVQTLAAKIYSLCGCSGICRIDFIRKDSTFYFLEVNTTPGMTETSFIPQQVKAAGLNLSELLTEIINDKLN
ncbi:MAG: D-alanine--D-alanine ligase [Bacteroidales bacterium]|nr:D-alanine--D-alanine ligase [Bacteroidales bacterium]